MNAWNKLPKDIQAIVETAAREASAELFQLHLVKGAEALKKFQEKGCEVIYLPDSEIKKIRKVAIEVWKEYAGKSDTAGKIYDSQKKWMEQLGLL